MQALELYGVDVPRERSRASSDGESEAAQTNEAALDGGRGRASFRGISRIVPEEGKEEVVRCREDRSV